ncbi:MAG: DNA polymerase/3'-5' exonuclease PolX [Thermosulfidibacteraceae bacterium]
MVERNKKLASLLDRIADFLELKGEVVYKVNAYRKAARVIEALTDDIEELVKSGEIDRVPGIGESIKGKILEFLRTGTIKKYEELKAEFPEELAELLVISNLGPKTLKVAYEKLGVRNLDDLIRVIENGSLAKLPGMGWKKVDNIRKGIELYLKGQRRMFLGEALEIANYVIENLKPFATSITYAGSLRRMKETIGDIDILATGNWMEIMNRFVSLPRVTDILAKGETKSSVMIGSVQVDLRVVKEDEWGSALQYFTGSKEHNIHLREIAKEKGLKLSEYGVFRIADNSKIAGRTEEDVYEAIGLCCIPPELREDRGEIERAMVGDLPKLVKYDEMKGDFHVHSNWSDGTSSIEDIAKMAEELGYEYVVISDHSKSMKIAHGLDGKRLLEQVEFIKKLNKKLKNVKILTSIEVDILPDGSLDLPDDVLKELDWVTASVHTRFNEDATFRIIRAIRNPYINSIGHPTGRLIFQRDSYPADWDRIFEEAKKYHVCMEINAQQDRLDLPDYLVKKAKDDYDLKFVIGTDAHHIGQMRSIFLGVAVARRGWLERENLLNTWSLEEVERFIKSVREEKLKLKL